MNKKIISISPCHCEYISIENKYGESEEYLRLNKRDWHLKIDDNWIDWNDNKKELDKIFEDKMFVIN